MTNFIGHQPGDSINPTPDCGGPRKPPGATEVWWCDIHREFHGPKIVAEIDQAGITVYGASLPPDPLEQARAIARELWTVIRTGAAYPDDLTGRIYHDPELEWLRAP